MLQHDSAPAFPEAAGDETECGLDALRVFLRDGRELGDGERLRGDHEQRLDGARKAVDGVLYEAEAFHTVMGSKGPA